VNLVCLGKGEFNHSVRTSVNFRWISVVDMKWEYLTEENDSDYSEPNRQYPKAHLGDYLDRIGEDGWEVIQIIYSGQSVISQVGGRNFFTVIAKRPKSYIDTTDVDVTRGIQVFVRDCGEHKISIIKIVAEITGLGLIEVKTKIDGVRCIFESSDFDEAREVMNRLGEAGAQVELRWTNKAGVEESLPF